MSIQDTALRLINEHGEKITITRKSGGSVDPITGIRASQAEETFYPYGLPISSKMDIERYFSSVSSSDKVYMMDASVTYQNGDKALVDGSIHTAKEIQKESKQGTAIYYMVRFVK